MIGTKAKKAKPGKRRIHVLFVALLALILFVAITALFIPLSTSHQRRNADDFGSDEYHRFFLPNTRDGSSPYSSSSSSADSLLPATCLSEQCISQTAATIARPFPLRTDKSTWCLPAPKSVDDRPFAGILLTKVPKGASSTSAGVAIRIAARHGCGSIFWSHRLAQDYRQEGYDPSTSFLFTTVRDPAARAVSTIYFHLLSRVNVTVNNALLMHLLRTTNHAHHGAISTGQGGFQLRYTSLHSIPEHSAWTVDAAESVLNPSAVVANVQAVLDSYDMILVTERMDESLTAMALLLGIDVGDVLVTSSKVAGSRYHLTHPNKTTFRCILPAKSTVSTKVESFLQSAEWRAMNYGDYLLHQAASQSLDLTIQNVIGQAKFDVALARYRRLQALESIECAPSVLFPCSDRGEPQMAIAKKNCYLYYYDFGCGYPCIDAMIERVDNLQD